MSEANARHIIVIDAKTLVLESTWRSPCNDSPTRVRILNFRNRKINVVDTHPLTPSGLPQVRSGGSVLYIMQLESIWTLLGGVSHVKVGYHHPPPEASQLQFFKSVSQYTWINLLLVLM